jgi:hypothetical protein
MLDMDIIYLVGLLCWELIKLYAPRQVTGVSYTSGFVCPDLEIQVV